MKIKYARTGQEISLDINTIQKEMVLFLLRNYLTSKDKSYRSIPKKLSLEEMAEVNPLNWESKIKTEYVTTYNKAVEQLNTAKVSEILTKYKIELSPSGEKAIGLLTAQNGKDITFADLSNPSLVSKVVKNPDSVKEARENREAGLTDAQFDKYKTFVGKEGRKSTKVNVVTKTLNKKKGEKVTIELRSIKFNEIDFNDPKNPKENSKIAVLEKLGFAPIALMDSRQTKKVGRRNIETTSKDDRESYREAEIAGGSLLSSGTNQSKYFYEEQFLNKNYDGDWKELNIPTLEKTLTNAEAEDLVLSFKGAYERTLERIKNQLEIGKRAKEDRYETKFTPKEIKFNNKFFSPLSKHANKDEVKVSRIVNGKKQTKTLKRKKGKEVKVTKKGDFITPDFNYINNVGEVDGKKITLLNSFSNVDDFKQTLTRLQNMFKEIGKTKSNTKTLLNLYKTYIGELKKLKQYVNREIEAKKEELSGFKERMDTFIEEKLEALESKTGGGASPRVLSNKGAKEAYKMQLPSFIRTTFSSLLRDLKTLYEIELKVEKTTTKYVKYKTGEKDKKGKDIYDKQDKPTKVTYDFKSPSLSNATHKIETKAANIGLDTKDMSRATYGKSYDRTAIKSAKAFIDSTKRGLTTLQNSLLEGV